MKLVRFWLKCRVSSKLNYFKTGHKNKNEKVIKTFIVMHDRCNNEEYVNDELAMNKIILKICHVDSKQKLKFGKIWLKFNIFF